MAQLLHGGITTTARTAGKPRRCGFSHPLGRLGRADGTEHRLAKPYHPWTSVQTGGKVTESKAIKQSMYGRAKFYLLCQRAL